MRYYVIATKWSDEKKKLVRYIAGEFNDYINAHIFAKAYNDQYCSDAHIVDMEKVIEQI